MLVFAERLQKDSRLVFTFATTARRYLYFQCFMGDVIQESGKVEFDSLAGYGLGQEPS